MHCIPESTIVCHLSPDISRHEKIIAGQVILVGPCLPAISGLYSIVEVLEKYFLQKEKVIITKEIRYVWNHV